MKEVSCKVLDVFFRKLPAKKVPPEALAEGTGYPVAHLRDKSERIEWAAFVRFMANVGALWSDQELVELASSLFQLPFARPFSAIARLIFSAMDVYRWLFEKGKGLGVQVFSCVVPKFEQLGPDRARLTMALQPGYSAPLQFFLVCQGSFIGMPLILGLPRAKVSIAATATEAVFEVEVPKGGGILQRAYKAMVFPLAALTVARELKSTNEQLLSRNDELEKARLELAARNAELTDVNAHLEEKVKERTVQLEESLHKVTEADRQKTEFFGNASHELRTPLTLMLGPLEVLANTPGLGAEAKAEVSGVLRSSYKLLKLVNDLLDLSKIEAGKMTLQMGAADLTQVLEEAARPWRPALKVRQVAFELELPPTLPLAGDAERLEQVALNLLSNAAKFTPDGGQITLRAGRDDRGLFFSVQNTGEGLEAEELPRLFGRFTQSSRGRSRRFGSTGLGLPVVKELVELHGGTIEADSKLGEWVRFTVHLPEGRVDASIQAPTVRPAATELRQYEAAATREGVAPEVRPAEPATAEQPTLLVAEDNEALRGFVVKHLASTFRILEAGDGEQALELARRFLPDVILSDLMMPRMDGLELCAALKADPATAHIPFVLLTARGDIENRLGGFEKGADDYLVKPFHLEELRARLQAQLRLRQLATRLAQKERLAALGLVVAGVAHEIRNPLNGIINALEPIKELVPNGNPEILELLDLAIDSSKRVEAISDQLLRQGRAGEGTRGEIDLGQNVGLALRLLQRRVGTVELSADLGVPHEFSVLGEAGALHQVWVNLIDNALQAAAPNGRVKVSVHQVDHQVSVEVADSGPGIEPKHLKRIFDPFFTTKSVGSGTGLGLAIVREIVEKHEGEITVDSVPGQGARFTVRLPASSGASVAHADLH